MASVPHFLQRTADAIYVAPMIDVINRPTGARKGLFDDSDVPAATPDIIIQKRPTEGQTAPPVLVGEVKYKAIDARVPREDINQVITYGASYRAQDVLIVRPRTEHGSHGLSLLGRIEKMQVFVYAIDLAGDLLNEEKALGDAVLGLLRPETEPCQVAGPP